MINTDNDQQILVNSIKAIIQSAVPTKNQVYKIERSSKLTVKITVK